MLPLRPTRFRTRTVAAWRFLEENGGPEPMLHELRKIDLEQFWAFIKWVCVPLAYWMPHLLAMLVLSPILSIKFSQEPLPSPLPSLIPFFFF